MIYNRSKVEYSAIWNVRFQTRIRLDLLGDLMEMMQGIF